MSIEHSTVVFYDNPYDEGEFGYDPITLLSKENERLRDLVSVMLPELKLRLKGFEQSWHGEGVGADVKRLTKLIIRAEYALSVP